MTIRKVIVVGDDGFFEQLQPTDTISVPMNTPSLQAITNGEASAAMPFGTPVYLSAPDTGKRAQASAKTTSFVAGLVSDPSIATGSVGNIAQSGILSGTTAQWDAIVTGQTGGLTFNKFYFLDPANLGKLTSTPPTTTGQCNMVIGRANSTTEMSLILGQIPIQL